MLSIGLTFQRKNPNLFVYYDLNIHIFAWTIWNIFLHKLCDWPCLWYPDQNWHRLAQMCECYDNGGKNVFKIVWIHFLFFVGNCLEVNRQLTASVFLQYQKTIALCSKQNETYFIREFDRILWVPSILGLSCQPNI